MEDSFHNPLNTAVDNPLHWDLTRIRERTLSYEFRTHFHPYVSSW